jgi:2-amino-4-hydroxy-6-hydroxymethyldihydropteridine diphosphokinase
MTDLYLSFGSNLGDRHTLLLMAIDLTARHVGSLVRCSSLIESEPWGFSSAHRFLNAVACYRTALSPREVLEVTQQIERQLGRQHKSIDGYADRPIDIDLLLYGDVRLDEPDLTIPHPLMARRDFVMKPLAEIAPELACEITSRSEQEPFNS